MKIGLRVGMVNFSVLLVNFLIQVLFLLLDISFSNILISSCLLCDRYKSKVNFNKDSYILKFKCYFMYHIVFLFVFIA